MSCSLSFLCSLSLYQSVRCGPVRSIILCFFFVFFFNFFFHFFFVICMGFTNFSSSSRDSILIWSKCFNWLGCVNVLNFVIYFYRFCLISFRGFCIRVLKAWVFLVFVLYLNSCACDSMVRIVRILLFSVVCSFSRFLFGPWLWFGFLFSICSFFEFFSFTIYFLIEWCFTNENTTYVYLTIESVIFLFLFTPWFIYFFEQIYLSYCCWCILCTVLLCSCVCISLVFACLFRVLFYSNRHLLR